MFDHYKGVSFGYRSGRVLYKSDEYQFSIKKSWGWVSSCTLVFSSKDYRRGTCCWVTGKD